MTKPYRNTDKPTVDLSSEAEVYLVRLALDGQARRLKLCAAELNRRKVPQVYMMTRRLAVVEQVLAGIPEGAHQWHLTNKEQVDRAANACEDLITILRLSLRHEGHDDYVSAQIKVLMPLLDRIRIGWKKPAIIPEDVLEQIKAREGGRFWNTTPGDWIEVEGEREDELGDYVWKTPVFDNVTDFEWIGI